MKAIIKNLNNDAVGKITDKNSREYAQAKFEALVAKVKAGRAYADHMSAFQSEPPRHDESDIAAAENDAALRRQFAENVCVVLRAARGQHARAMTSVDADLAGRPFPAAGGENERAAPHAAHAFSSNQSQVKIFAYVFNITHK